MEFTWNKIYLGDNIDHLRKMVKDKITFNLILTDPPYNIGKSFGNNTDNMEIVEFLDCMDERLNLMSKLLTNNGSIIWFCIHRFAGDIQLLMRKYFQQRRMMIWYYENGMSRQTKEPVTEYEPFWWFSKTDKFIYNLDDVRVPYKTDRVKNPIYKIDSHGDKRAWNPHPKGRKRGDVWCCPTLAGKIFEDERTGHPTQKPMRLWTELIRAFCPKDMNGKYEGRILDPNMGCGTTAACCEKMNRVENHKIRWSGSELQQEWIDVAYTRIEREKNRVVEPDIFET